MLPNAYKNKGPCLCNSFIQTYHSWLTGTLRGDVGQKLMPHFTAEKYLKRHGWWGGTDWWQFVVWDFSRRKCCRTNTLRDQCPEQAKVYSFRTWKTQNETRIYSWKVLTGCFTWRLQIITWKMINMDKHGCFTKDPLALRVPGYRCIDCVLQQLRLARIGAKKCLSFVVSWWFFSSL